MRLVTKSIGKLALEIKTGKTPPTKEKKYFNNDIPWYTPVDINGKLLSSNSKRGISKLAVSDKKAVIFKKNTVLISCIGEIGRVGITTTEISSSNQQITGVKLKEDINPLFFLYWCKSHKLAFSDKARKAVVPILNNAILSKIKITYPESINDQIRIATLLSRIEALIATRKENLRLLDQFLKSTFLEMFGDPVRNEKGWNLLPCTKVVRDIVSGTSYGGVERSELETDELGVLKISAVTKGSLDTKEIKAVKKAIIKKKIIFLTKGDFLFSRANTAELVAACCIVDKDYPELFIPDKLWRLTLDKSLVKPQYFNYLFKNESFRNTIRHLASGGHKSMLNISMSKFRTLKIPIPDKKKQDKFSLIVEKVESIKSLYQQNLIDLENLYGSVSQKAFKGELDLSSIPLPKKSIQIEDISADYSKEIILSDDKGHKMTNNELFNKVALEKYLKSNKGKKLSSTSILKALKENYSISNIDDYLSYLIELLENKDSGVEQVFSIMTKDDNDIEPNREIGIHIT